MTESLKSNQNRTYVAAPPHMPMPPVLAQPGVPRQDAEPDASL